MLQNVVFRKENGVKIPILGVKIPILGVKLK